MEETRVRLTEFSHGAGCGCKLSPKVLGEILHGQIQAPEARLLVGNDARDDAAVWLLEREDETLIATIDFFMPVVDDPFDFGRIAAANAISDVYAMGGRPNLALAVLGWPLAKLSPGIARRVVEGGRAVCAQAGCVLAGGHSIDAPEPMFGLSVCGTAPRAHIKTNRGGKAGDLLFLTKPLGIGLYTTAEKKQCLKPEHTGRAVEAMLRLNKPGVDLGRDSGVHALTDVTGFGLVGHLSELCLGSGVAARVKRSALPLLPDLEFYIGAGAVPGGTGRNRDAYQHLVEPLEEPWSSIVFDPQTSGGLLVACAPEAVPALEAVFQLHEIGEFASPIGELVPAEEGRPPIRFLP
ncbi:MAG: selenide, water dikinase SelD [Spirochaetes bacterium]|nr:selenide, water dikinase SelD [Spirochaetota bacterium]